MSGEKNAEVVAQIERNPSIVGRKGFLRKLLDYRRQRVLDERFDTWCRRISVSGKTVVLVVFAAIWAKYLSQYFRPITHHQTRQQISVVIKDPGYIKRWLSQLSEEEKKIIVKTYVNNNKRSVQEGLDKALMSGATNLFDFAVQKVQSDYQPMVALVKERAKRNPLVSTKGVKPNLTLQEAEAMLLEALGRNKEQVVYDLFKILRKYYVVEVLYEELPGFAEGLFNTIKSAAKGDMEELYRRLSMMEADPKFKRMIDDKINQQIRAQLAPIWNDIIGRLSLTQLWGETTKTVDEIINNPSQAEAYLRNYYRTLKRAGTGYLVLVLIMALTGTLSTAFLLLRTFVFIYIRDIIVLVTRDIRKTRRIMRRRR